MKRLVKRNQIIIAALAVMIAVAGYLNYSGRLFGDAGTSEETGSDLANQELLDISEEDAALTDGEAEGEVADAEVEGTPGEAVLTSSEAGSVVAEAKVSREQVRAKNKETLQAIIDDDSLTDEQKSDAVAQMVEITELAEQEVAVETLLASKGFTESVVSLTADSADVVVNQSSLSDAQLAQIEDIVTRKTNIAPASIVITSIHSGEEAAEE
ncbi:MAG TPA: SpoIIIAH-like family protein [Candidatus Bariatricus faecipullorum]|nr:SpoIIIAH-like family protein [Candidatus Bariatricus faecipullorum]